MSPFPSYAPWRTAAKRWGTPAAQAASALDDSIRDLVQAGDQNLGHLEVQAAHDVLELLRQTVEWGAQAKADASPPSCPVCGHKLTRCSDGHARTFECRYGRSRSGARAATANAAASGPRPAMTPSGWGKVPATCRLCRTWRPCWPASCPWPRPAPGLLPRRPASGGSGTGSLWRGQGPAHRLAQALGAPAQKPIAAGLPDPEMLLALARAACQTQQAERAHAWAARAIQLNPFQEFKLRVLEDPLLSALWA